jgi:4-aminobutyrate aminotransferase-like enzyme
MDMFFLGNSDAEALEGAIKLACYATNRKAIIAFVGSFHGRTYGAASVTSVKLKYRLHYEPFVPNIYFAEYPYPFRCPMGKDSDMTLRWNINNIQQIFDYFVDPSEVAAILVEPIQDEGGFIVPSADFLPTLRKICDEHGILLIIDKIQFGFGRTGEMLTTQVFNKQPDINTIAKAIANGYLVSDTIASKKLMSNWYAGSHGITFGGKPIVCTAAPAVLEVFENDNILENCRAMENA